MEKADSDHFMQLMKSNFSSFKGYGCPYVFLIVCKSHVHGSIKSRGCDIQYNKLVKLCKLVNAPAHAVETIMNLDLWESVLIKVVLIKILLNMF